MCHQRLGNDAAAVASLRRAADLDPTSVAYLTEYALALRKKGATDGAIATLKKALDLAPDDPEVHLQMGFLWMDKKRWRDAAAEMRQSADLRPDDPQPWFYLAIVQGDHLGKPDEALTALRRYRDLGGKDPAALSWLASLESDR